MQLKETHKNFEDGSKGRLVIKTDGGEVIDTIFTMAQKTRKFCEANPDSEAGKRYAAALVTARRDDLKAVMEELETKIVDTVSDSVANNAAIDNMQRFLTENSDELFALGLRSVRDAAAASSLAVPAPPAITGKNPANTALISAQRKLQKLYEAAQGTDPVAAVTSIKTTRGNPYLNACNDYQDKLLKHFKGAGTNGSKA